MHPVGMRPLRFAVFAASLAAAAALTTHLWFGLTTPGPRSLDPGALQIRQPTRIVGIEIAPLLPRFSGFVGHLGLAALREPTGSRLAAIARVADVTGRLTRTSQRGPAVAVLRCLGREAVGESTHQ